jgi:hypothetical protein
MANELSCGILAIIPVLRLEPGDSPYFVESIWADVPADDWLAKHPLPKQNIKDLSHWCTQNTQFLFSSEV